MTRPSATSVAAARLKVAVARSRGGRAPEWVEELARVELPAVRSGHTLQDSDASPSPRGSAAVDHVRPDPPTWAVDPAATEGIAGRGQAFPLVNGELLSATDHLDDVVRLIGEAEVREVNRRLGLARIVCNDLEAATGRLSAQDSSLSSDADVLTIVDGLRRRFAHDWGGWVPLLGPNRVVIGPSAPFSTLDGGAPLPGLGRTWVPEPSRREGGGAGMSVALLDTPVDASLVLDHMLDGRSSRLDARDVTPVALGHGTFAAGLVHALAPEAEILVRGILGARSGTSEWDAAVALTDITTEQRPDVVLMSFGCLTEDGRPPIALSTAVAALRDEVVLVAPAGDLATARPEASRLPVWPAALSSVVAVGMSPRGVAERGNDRPPWVQILAPGEDVEAPFLRGNVEAGGKIYHFDGSARWSGSSVAAAAAVGRLVSIAGGTGVREVLGQILRSEISDDVLRLPSSV